MPSETDNPAAALTRGERVRAAARTLRVPRSASWVADETEVSVKTAQKYLDQLVEDNVLRAIDSEEQRRYCVDQLMASYREIATLQREHSRQSLTDTLETMRTRIDGWKDDYGVETPGELRSTIAEVSDETERDERKKAASEWEHFTDRMPVVQAALTEYDWAVDRDRIHG